MTGLFFERRKMPRRNVDKTKWGKVAIGAIACFIFGALMNMVVSASVTKVVYVPEKNWRVCR